MGTGGGEDPRPGPPAWPVSVIVGPFRLRLADPSPLCGNRVACRGFSFWHGIERLANLQPGYVKPALKRDPRIIAAVGCSSSLKSPSLPRTGIKARGKRARAQLSSFEMKCHADPSPQKMRLLLAVRFRADTTMRYKGSNHPRWLRKRRRQTPFHAYLHTIAFSNCSSFFASSHAVERLCCIDWFCVKPIALPLIELPFRSCSSFYFLKSDSAATGIAQRDTFQIKVRDRITCDRCWSAPIRECMIESYSSLIVTAISLRYSLSSPGFVFLFRNDHRFGGPPLGKLDARNKKSGRLTYRYSFPISIQRGRPDAVR